MRSGVCIGSRLWKRTHVWARKSPGRITGAKICWRGWGLGLGHQARLDGLHRDPHAFHLTARELDANALHVWTETTLGIFNQAGTDTAALFGETFTDDATAFYGALACDCANT